MKKMINLEPIEKMFFDHGLINRIKIEESISLEVRDSVDRIIHGWDIWENVYSQIWGNVY